MDLAKFIENKKIKISKNAKAVLEIIYNESEPVSADYIYEKLRKINPSVSMSTVYRVLEKLTLNNVLSKALIMNDNKAKYEIKGHKTCSLFNMPKLQ
ncbi:MAG: transcriptional repressor [Bacillus subtilis]|nr:transcriptional repressor [Bacillus subtilis]